MCKITKAAIDSYVSDIVEQIGYDIDNGIDPHTALNENVGECINLTMGYSEQLKLVEVFSGNFKGVFVEPSLDLNGSFETIIGDMAENVLSRLVTEALP